MTSRTPIVFGLLILLGAFGGTIPSTQAAVSDSAELATIDSDHYEVRTSAGPSEIGKTAHVEVTIQAKPGFKVNKAYPTKLELKPAPDGIEYPKPVLKRGDGEIRDDGKEFVFRAPWKAKRAGDFPFEGLLKFSVCNESRCLIERQNVTVTLTAK